MLDQSVLQHNNCYFLITLQTVFIFELTVRKVARTWYFYAIMCAPLSAYISLQFQVEQKKVKEKGFHSARALNLWSHKSKFKNGLFFYDDTVRPRNPMGREVSTHKGIGHRRQRRCCRQTPSYCSWWQHAQSYLSRKQRETFSFSFLILLLLSFFNPIKKFYFIMELRFSADIALPYTRL